MRYRFAKMVIEFVGCSGAGKTTHVQSVLMALSKNGRTAASSTALVARATRTAWISNLFVRNICLNVILFPWLLLALRHHSRFFFFGLRQILRRADSVMSILQRSLSQLRSLAGNEILRHLRCAPEFILVDEGTICGIHNVLVYLSGPPAASALQAYARLAPKPDLIIHINTPVEVALSRTRSRPDPPLRFHSLPEKLQFVRFAHETHIQLSRCQHVRQHWHIVCPTGDRTADEIVGAILSKEKEFV